MIGLTLWPLVIIQVGNWKLIRKNVVLALPSLLQDYNLLSDFLLIWCRKWNIYKFFGFYSFIKLEILKSNNYNSDIWYKSQMFIVLHHPPGTSASASSSYSQTFSNDFISIERLKLKVAKSINSNAWCSNFKEESTKISCYFVLLRSLAKTINGISDHQSGD